MDYDGIVTFRFRINDPDRIRSVGSANEGYTSL